MFNISLSNQAKKGLKSLDKRLFERIKNALLYIKDNPLPIKRYDIRKVSGEPYTYRIRISRYRIVYYIDWKNNSIDVIKIEKKGDETYKKI